TLDLVETDRGDVEGGETFGAPGSQTDPGNTDRRGRGKWESTHGLLRSGTPQQWSAPHQSQHCPVESVTQEQNPEHRVQRAARSLARSLVQSRPSPVGRLNIGIAAAKCRT